MIFGFPTKKDWDELKEREAKNLELRDKVFQVILDGQNFMRKFGVISNADYWEWRLKFDLERYNITPRK